MQKEKGGGRSKKIGQRETTLFFHFAGAKAREEKGGRKAIKAAHLLLKRARMGEGRPRIVLFYTWAK